MRKLLFAFTIALSISAHAQTQETKGQAQTRQHCKAIKKDGTPCKSTIVLSNGYCKAHDPAAPKCGAKTTSGKPCQMSVKKVGDRCRFHDGKEGAK